MRIEDVEELAESAKDNWHLQEPEGLFLQAIEALRAEAWYPIEKAEEMGAKDGRLVLLFRIDYWTPGYWDSDYQCWMHYEGEVKPDHFRFINPPEGS
jgi:hypothetical protein